MNRNALLAFLGDERVVCVLARHVAGGGSLESRYAGFSSRLSADRLVLPVFGVQGAGKSTLLNAIAFGEPVLPVDADETTAVPVEVVYAESPSDEAEVHFRDGRMEKVPRTEAALGRYGHNLNNPGNERGIDRIVVETDARWMAGGLVLVDLPGTGSLTAANAETTRKYLEEAVGVIYLLRTTPPMTRSESAAVAAAWSQTPLAFFVQNRWTDESAEHAEEGRTANVRALVQLAERYRVPSDGEPGVIVVNAYAAWKSRLSDDGEGRRGSGIGDLEATLLSASDGWKESLERAVLAAAVADVDSAAAAATQSLRDLTFEAAELEVQLAEEEARFERYFGGLHSRAKEVLRKLETFESEQGVFLDEWARTTQRELRNRMRTKMRSGIVDGPRLSRALRDEQTAALDDAFSQVHEALHARVDDVRQQFAGALEWTAVRAGTVRTVSVEERTKLENLAPHVGRGALGMGGVALGAKLGAKIGLKLGIAGGPWGMAIGLAGGAAVGALGGFVGGWLGKKGRVAVTEWRAGNIEPQVFEAIEDFVTGTADTLRSEIAKCMAALRQEIDGWLGTQQAFYAAEREMRLRVGGISAEEKRSLAEKLEADLVVLGNARSSLLGDRETA